MSEGKWGGCGDDARKLVDMDENDGRGQAGGEATV